MKPEFKVGDKVTFKPYEKALPAVVRAIQYGMSGKGKTMFGASDDRIFYKLGGDRVVSVTTGRSIVESKHYKPFDINEKVLY